MVYSILTEARIKNSVADLQPEERAYSTFWPTNGDLEGWTTIFDLDIVGVWNAFLFGTKRESVTGSIGPTDNFPPVDAQINERIFFRLKYDKHPKNSNSTNLGKIQFTTVADPIFNDDKSVTFTLISDGKWNFYELNMGEVPSWVGLVNNVRFFPCINGARNDEFFLNFFEIGTNVFPFSLENSRAGTSGRATGATALNSSITIQKDVNDKLVVNIDDYGDVRITLTAQTVPPELIARDISLQLGKVGIGGYIRAEAFIESSTSKLVIESGIRAADSSVQIKFGTESAGTDLGFFDTTGFALFSSTPGTDPAGDYTPLSSYSLTTLELLSLFDNDIDLPAFTIDPQSFTTEGGRRDFGTTNRRLTTEIVIEGRGTDFQGQTIQTTEAFDGQSKTLIDINHPFTDNGRLDKIFINGIADTGGASKWKILRPKLDGTLTVIATGEIGKTPSLSGGLVLTTEAGVYVADVSGLNINVRRGDLLGIFNADLHTGAFGSIKADAMFYDVTGEATGTFTPPPPSGAGEAGLPIYARSSSTKNRAVLDIDLGNRLNLDTIKVHGFEDIRDLEYNVAIASSAVFQADVAGDHQICFNINPNDRICFPRDNATFNIDALNDDIIFAENGIAGFGDGGPSGAGGADVPGATYFYVNGDGEFLGTQEFVGQGPLRFEFTRDAYGIDCFFSSSTPRLDKPIGKAIIFFKDKKNQRSWQVETGVSGGGNGSKSGFQLIPSITAVEIDEKRIEALRGFVTTKTSSDASTILLNNPVILDTIAADGTVNPQLGVDFTFNVGELGGVNVRDQTTFHEFQWNRFQWEFDAIRTTAFRYFSTFHWSTKISEFQIFAVSPSLEALGDNTQILFSNDGEAFSTAELLTSTNIEADYKLGGSPQFLRLIFRPTLQLTLTDVQVNFEEDQVCFGEEGRILGAVTIDDARIGSVGEATPLKVTNNTGEQADLTLDIPVDINSARQLLYFSKLNSASDITTPQVGPPGRVDFVSDKILKEEENLAINARCYGLVNLVSGTGSTFVTDNLLVNPGFETGDLTGWDLVVLQSGTRVTNSGSTFQVPRVINIDDPPDEDTAAGFFQAGNFIFGVSVDTEIEEHGFDVSDTMDPIEFELDQTVDVSEFADQIDQGGALLDLTFRYIAFFSGAFTLRYLGSPTVSGIEAVPGTIVNSTYGSNLLRSTGIPKSENVATQNTSASDITFTTQARVKKNTRFIRLQVDCTLNNGVVDSFVTLRRQKFISDDYDLTLELPAKTTAKWYKSWRTGLGSTDKLDGFTDSSFEPVTSDQFVTTTGSTHWYQPFDINNTTGSPGGGQVLGFSNPFLQNRFEGVQSFRQMVGFDRGILGAQWEQDKELVGFRIAMHHNSSSSSTFSADAWPRRFQVEVLKTQAELSGDVPDININEHFKIATVYQNVDAELGPGTDIVGTPFNGPTSIITTWLFEDNAITTRGMRLVFLTNCDRFERAAHANASAFSSDTGCPSDNQVLSNDWISDRGIGVSYFVPLESVGITTLPTDNIQETHITTAPNPSGNVFIAVDLGRIHAIDISSELFELIAATPSQTEFNLGTVDFSATDTDDPNLVQWTSGSSNARWVRFTTAASVKFEDSGSLLETTGSPNNVRVEKIPQAILNQARIYPDITKTLFHTVGYNSEWTDLGTNLSDNLTSTSIVGNDFPVIALDLGKDYIIANDTDVLRKRHDTIGPDPDSSTGSIDKRFWDGSSESNWTYGGGSATSTDRPELVEFQAFGAGVLDTSVRWVAVKIAEQLQDIPSAGSPPKEYNFNTPGLTLFYIKVKPRNPEVFTQNFQWFDNKKSALKDISTFKFALGEPISVLDGIDYGSSAGALENSSVGTGDNLGDPYSAFDGKFDELGANPDIWGVSLRGVDGITTTSDAFPHNIWRVFRNTQTGVTETKTVKAIKIKGFNENFYPTSFRFEKLLENTNGVAKDPNLDSSWATVDDGTFTNVNTFQEGEGFTAILPTAVETKGIRVRISNSVFVDDSVESDVDPDTGFLQSTNPQTSGPQTRVSEIIIYEEVVEESLLTGTIDINHMLSASVSSSTSTPGHPIDKLNDDDIGSYWQSTGFLDTVSISLPGTRDITRLEWAKDPDLSDQSAAESTNAPRNFSLDGIVGGTQQVLLVGLGIEQATFSGTLTGAPVSAKDFTFEVTEVQGQQEDANSIIISELRLIEVIERSTPLTTIESSISRRPGGTNTQSTKITYVANTDVITKVSTDGIDGNNDAVWSQRDFFSLWVFVNDISLLDTVFGNFKLGNSSETYYRWDFKNLNLQTGWNELKLQFRTADDISAIEFQPGFQYSSDTGESQVDFLTKDVTITANVDGNFSQRIVQAPGIRFFEMEFRGTKGSSDLVVILDDFRFIRNKFEDVCKFAPALYLNNSEVFTIFLEGLDIGTGTVEFWFQPDWDTGGRLAADRPIIPALFRIMRPDGKFLSLFYRPNQGFVTMISDGVNLLQFVSNVSLYRFERFETFHVALVWSSDRQVRTQSGGNASLVLYINGEPIFGTDQTWESVGAGGATVMFGGEVGQRFAATPDNSTSLLFTAVPTQPAKNTASTWGLIENLKIYNYPKVDFSDINTADLRQTQLTTPSEMIEISIDGTNFFGVGSDQLPLSVQDVSSGESATVYIRTNIPKDLTGDENRDASLLVRWKTPLRDCN